MLSQNLLYFTNETRVPDDIISKWANGGLTKYLNDADAPSWCFTLSSVKEVLLRCRSVEDSRKHVIIVAASIPCIEDDELSLLYIELDVVSDPESFQPVKNLCRLE